MADETKNSIHPQDGNQIVIGENHATITIHNNSKQNDIEKLSSKFDNVMSNVERILIDNVVTIKSKRKRKSK